MTPEDKLTKAKMDLILDHPFFASLMLRLKPVEISDENVCKTMATNSVYLRYNPEFLKLLSPEDIVGVLCHEVMHIVLMHPFRRGNREMNRWQAACDYAINSILAQDRSIKMPGNLLYNRDYDNLSAEQIYDLLPEMPNMSSQSQSEALVSGNIGDTDDYSPEDKEGDSDSENGESKDTNTEHQEQDWKMAIASAANSARMAGKLPAGMDRLINNILNQKLPWQEILARFITENAKDDYSFKMPNKRFAYTGLYLPTLQNPKLGTIAVIIDTSGSIDNVLLDEFASELRAILALCPGTEVEVVYVDHEVAGHERLTSEDLKFNPKGGGGTCFRPGFKYLDEADIDPVCTLYFTDGYCSSFPQEPGHPVLWIISRKGMSDRFSPPFGEVIGM